MTARAEIENVLGLASWGYDEDDVDLIAEQFTDTATMTMQIGRGGDTIGPFEGRAAIRTLHADSLAAQTDQRRHNLSNVVITRETADTAATTANLTLLSVEDGKVAVLSSGWYRDEFVNQDGRWRIATRHIYLDLPY